MQSARLIKSRVFGGNDFRPGWTYQRLPAGDTMLEQGKGLSPAFFNLLDAVYSVRPVSFAELQRTFPRLHEDDLELWLAELCRMKLITPAAHSDEVPAANDAKALVPQPRSAQVKVEAPVAKASPAPVAPVQAAAAKTETAAPALGFDLDFMPVLDFTATGDFAPPVPAGTPTLIEDAIALFATPPAAPAVQVETQGVAAALLALKHKSLDALYDELSAICAELEAREQACAVPA